MRSRAAAPSRAGAVPARALAVLYSNYTHVVTLGVVGHSRHRGSARAASCRPDRPGSGTEVIAFASLRAAGLDPDRDVTRQGLGASESADALKDGKIDAFFWSGGLPTAAIQDLSHTPGDRHAAGAERRAAAAAAARATGDLYFELQVPAGAYPGGRRAVRSWALRTCWS